MVGKLPVKSTKPARQKAEPAPGSARSALRNRDFRILWSGSFASNIGTWMQNVAMGPYALALSKTAANPKGSGSFVALVSMAQMGPMMILAVVGGVLANRVRRRPLIISAQAILATMSITLAIMALGSPTKTGVVICVLIGGVANALSGPAFQSVGPELVDRKDLPGVISLGSTSLNGSRVIGPILLVLLRPLGVGTSTKTGIAAVFIINAMSYCFSIYAVSTVSIADVPPRQAGDAQGFRQLLTGYREARANPVAGRVLSSLFMMSLVCLVFIPQFPTVAERNLGIGSRTVAYSVMFGVWGFGAMLGSLSQSTVLARQDKRALIPIYFIGFAVAITAFAFVRVPWLAFPSVFVLGFFYFATTTSLSTVLQQHLGSRERAPIMSLWMMAFGGTIAIGGVWSGWAMDRWSVTGVLLIGAVAALGLSRWAQMVPLSERMRADGSLEARIGK